MNKVLICTFIAVILSSCASTPYAARDLSDVPEAFTALQKKLPSAGDGMQAGASHEPDAGGLIRNRNDLILFSEKALRALRITMSTINNIIVASRQAAAVSPRTTTVPPVTPNSPAATVKPVVTAQNNPVEAERPQTINPETRTVVQPVVTEKEADPVRASFTAPAQGVMKTVWARKGDAIEISLDGKGWILLEMPKKEDGLEYISSNSEDGKSIFRLRGRLMGNFLLPFQFQDSLAGVLKKETIEIAVVDDETFARVMQQGGNLGPDRAGQLDEAYALLARKQYDDALSRFLAVYQENDPLLNDTIANIYFQRRDYDNAVRYWKKNLSQNNPQHDNALLGISMAYRAQKNNAALIAHTRFLLSDRRLPAGKEFIELSRYFILTGQSQIALDLLNEYLARYPYSDGLDEVYYLLAKMYEDVADIRDFRKSKDFYTIVVKEYPESRFAEESRERMDYIDRYYIKVR